MGWIYDDTGEPVPQHLQPKGKWVYEDNNQPVPQHLVPGGAPFQPGWRGQTMREMTTPLLEQTPTIHGMFDAPVPGELNPTAQRLEDWLRAKGAPVERALPEWAQPIVDPVLQPATPAEAATTAVGGIGTALQGLEAIGAPESFGISAAMIPPTQWATRAAQLATAGIGGALEAQPGHRIEMAEDEALKTALGLALSQALHIPYMPRLRGILKPLASTFAPAIGRVGTPAVAARGPEAVRRVLDYLRPEPMGGGEGEGGKE